MSKHSPTGPGRVTTSKVVPVGGVRAVLSNYDIDVDMPKAEHLAFLNSKVVPILISRRARVWGRVPLDVEFGDGASPRCSVWVV